MAKVTIEIEDRPDGMVKITATPNFETMMAMDASGEKLTSAHGLALWMLNRTREESKRKEPTLIHLPRLGR